jgi:uncharacterized membrane protein
MNANTTSGSLYNWTQAIYALHAFSLLTGILGAATVVGAFLTGWPSLIGVILNYIKRNEARGTWLESHFRWQIRTFWYGLLWVCLCLLFVVMTLGIGILIAVDALPDTFATVLNVTGDLAAAALVASTDHHRISN